jgi:hypothetical protein
MAETYTGLVQDGVIVFEGPPPPLAVGTRVRIELIEPEPEDESTPTLADRLRPIIGAAKGLPTDLAEQHDHYLHGTPKRFEEAAPETSRPAADPVAGTRALLLAWARRAEEIAPPLPSDLAENHDHYAHGKPRE